MMNETDSTTAQEQLIDTMIDLARLSQSHRIIIAGRDSLGIHRALHCRGFVHASTTAACRTSRGQHSAGLIVGDRSFQDLETSLVCTSQLLNATAAIVVSIESPERGLRLRVRTKQEQLVFRIEAGVRCQQGFLLSAYRCNFASIAKAA